MSGRVALVTGATGGLGLAAATALAQRNADLWIVGRDPQRTEAARRAIAAVAPDSSVTTAVADLAVLDDVRNLADRIRRSVPRLDVLIHNAGALTHDLRYTADGLEVTAQVHVVAPFLLTTALLPILQATPDARVITVSSGGMYTQRLDLDALATPAIPFNGVRAYANAKRAQVVLNELWSKHRGASGVVFHAMHPGWADTPGVRESLPRFRALMGPLLRTPSQGADTMVWLAADPRALETNGQFWLDRRPRSVAPLPGTRTSDADAERCWNWCAERAGSRCTAGGGAMKIAIVGTGVSGLVAAHLLHPHHEITVFESDTRIGGHANTVDVEVDGRSVAVDTGFIVYNDRNYPGFRALLDRLGVATQPTEMSFSVSDPRTGLEFRGSNLNAIFAQRRNLANPSFLRLLADVTRFNRAARRLVAGEARWNGPDRLPDGGGFDAHAEESLADFVRRGRFSQSFVRQFLIPFGASIWSADPATFMRFPVRAYARFMDNHGLLELAGRPEWRTVTGGSRRYVEALTAPFSHRIQLDMPVHKIVTHDGVGGSQLVEVLTGRGPELFDRVIVATHSDQALRMLADASTAEREVLGAIGYQRNIATLHTDERMLPRNPRARASWNYTIAENARGTTVTYWMNRLQSIETRRPLLVTLNRPDEIDPRMRIAEFEYDHPVFDVPAMAAQQRRAEIQGRRGIYFAGAYWGYGFHEDGVQSALEVVRLLESRR